MHVGVASGSTTEPIPYLRMPEASVASDLVVWALCLVLKWESPFLAESLQVLVS